MAEVQARKQTATNQSESCPLSQSLERMVLQDPLVNTDKAGKSQWGALALANMVTILREHGYTIREPSAGSGDDDNAEQVSWSDDTVTGAGPHAAPSSAPSTERAVAVEASNVEADALARFHLLTSLMEQNRGEDGRVSAVDLEQSLLSQDADAFVKEGVDQLKQYLMKARENGIPIKFDGDRSGLHQVWFKGHKDLSGALARYSHHGGASSRSLNSPSGPRHGEDWDWRRRPYQQQQQQQQQQQHGGGGQRYMAPGYTIRNSDMPNRYRTPSERAFDIDFLLDVLHTLGADFSQGADANLVEQKLLEVAQSLYEIKAGVKRFNHYLMNMRAAGAPIWFSRDDEGLPREIFIKNLSASPNPIPFPTPVPAGISPANDWSGMSPRSSAVHQQQQGRFASLIEAYQYHLQPEKNVADGHLVQSRLEAMDSNIYAREQCPSFKHLLKLARGTGLDMNWDQSDTGVATIRMRLIPQQQQQPYHHD